MTANAPSTTLVRRGPFLARRQHDLSSPTLIGSLLVIAALGVIAGLVLFGKMVSDDVAKQDRARLADAAMISASRIDRLVLRAELDMSNVLRGIETANVALPAEELRMVRREISDMLETGPLSGIAVIDDKEAVVLEVAQTASPVSATAFAQPLESEARLLSSRLRMTSSEPTGAPVLHLRSGAGRGWRVVGRFEDSALLDALRPEDGLAGVVYSYLLDQEGRVLATLGDQTAPDRLDGPSAPYNAAPLDEAAVTAVSDRAGAQRLFATAVLDGEDLRVVHVGRSQGGGAVFKRAGMLTVALAAPCLLGLILLISIIQNEWRKSDRRANSASDAVARAEVASDLLQAGIVDWNTGDSSVVYTRGWRDLFGYSDDVGGEQVFDWIARIHPEDRPGARARYQKLMDGDISIVDHTIRVLCAGGDYTHVRERAAVRSDEGGQISRIVLVQTPFVLNRAEDAAA